MMAVRVRNIASRAQPKIQSILFGNPLFVTIDDARHFFRKRGSFGPQPKRLVIAHLVVRHANKDRSDNQQEQREGARDRRHTGAQVNGADSSFAFDYFHYS
jgi:hypothetical protein